MATAMDGAITAGAGITTVGAAATIMVGGTIATKRRACASFKIKARRA